MWPEQPNIITNDYRTVIQGEDIIKWICNNTNPSFQGFSSHLCHMNPCWLESQVWIWLSCVRVMDARLSWSTQLLGFESSARGDDPWMKRMYPKTLSEKYYHNKPWWNMALVTVGFPAVKHCCCAEGAHAEAGTWPHADRVRNAVSRPHGSVCFSYHHTHWKWFRRKIPFLILTVHQRITLNSLMMHAHDVKADSR